MKNFVVIPTYNEKENIAPLIEEIFKHSPSINVLVVDDNSPDGTADEVKKIMPGLPNLSLLERPSKNGLGGAYIAAFKEIIKDEDVKNIITMDADFSHNPSDIGRLLNAAGDKDLVIGSRYIYGGSIAQWELWRQLLSRAGNVYVQAVLRKPIRDWTSGFTCFRSDILKKIDLARIDLSGYAFLQELKYLLLKAGATSVEIPIRFGARRGGESKLSGFIIREGIIGPWKMLLKK